MFGLGRLRKMPGVRRCNNHVGSSVSERKGLRSDQDIDIQRFGFGRRLTLLPGFRPKLCRQTQGFVR